MARGPGRSELRFRLAFSILGLCLVGVALALNPPSGWATPVVFEVVLIAGGFFGLSALWSALALLRSKREEK